MSPRAATPSARYEGCDPALSVRHFDARTPRREPEHGKRRERSPSERVDQAQRALWPSPMKRRCESDEGCSRPGNGGAPGRMRLDELACRKAMRARPASGSSPTTGGLNELVPQATRVDQHADNEGRRSRNSSSRSASLDELVTAKATRDAGCGAGAVWPRASMNSSPRRRRGAGTRPPGGPAVGSLDELVAAKATRGGEARREHSPPAASMNSSPRRRRGPSGGR